MNGSNLIAPYGDKLINLMVPQESRGEKKSYASSLPSIQIPPRFVCDLEMLSNGAYSPLDRFMGQEDFQQVIYEWRLKDGSLYPLPINLPVHPFPELQLDKDIAIRNNEFQLLAIMTVEEIYQWDWTEVAQTLYGTHEPSHPIVAEMRYWGTFNISGRIQLLNLPQRYDFQESRQPPSKTREILSRMKARKVVASNPQKPTDLNLEELLSQVSSEDDDVLFMNLSAGLIKLGDMDFFNNIRFYRAAADHLSETIKVFLNLSPLVNRQAESRELLWKSLIFRNYGADHFFYAINNGNQDIRSEDRIFPPGNENLQGLERFSLETGVNLLPALGMNHKNKSNRSVHSILNWNNEHIKTTIDFNADYKIHPSQSKKSRDSNLHFEVEKIFHDHFPSRKESGVCIWFTGLSGSGKSTTAEILSWFLLEQGRKVSVLDGDVVRTHLSKGLGFSKQDRDINVRRIGYVASELVRLDGLVICAVVSPYREARQDVRNMVGQDKFVEVFVDTPLEECEKRDVKGIYAKARSGEIKGFTGIDDPYEPPTQPEIRLDSIKYSPIENAEYVLGYLIEEGFVLPGMEYQSVNQISAIKKV